MKTAYRNLKEKIDGNNLVILDGGVGTELQFRGIEMDETWCGSASLNTEVLEQIHLDYINAGAEVITTNTYASSRLMLEAAGLGNNFEEINRNESLVLIEKKFCWSDDSCDEVYYDKKQLQSYFRWSYLF